MEFHQRISRWIVPYRTLYQSQLRTLSFAASHSLVTLAISVADTDGLALTHIHTRTVIIIKWCYYVDDSFNWMEWMARFKCELRSEFVDVDVWCSHKPDTVREKNAFLHASACTVYYGIYAKFTTNFPTLLNWMCTDERARIAFVHGYKHIMFTNWPTMFFFLSQVFSRIFSLWPIINIIFAYIFDQSYGRTHSMCSRETAEHWKRTILSIEW